MARDAVGMARMGRVYPVEVSECFSLVKGGLAYRLLTRAGLICRETHDVTKAAIVLAAVTWLPLLVLSAAQGLAIGQAVQVPFLCDFAAYARFIVAVPMFLLAEMVVDRWLRPGVEQFRRTALIEEADIPRFDAAVRQVSMLRDSALAELVILAGIWATAALGFSHEVSGQVSTWRAPSHHLTPQGWYYAFVSMSIFRFLFYRWGLRIIIWFWFLFRVSRLHLKLIPTHPDLSGGLGFLGVVQSGFWPVVLPASTVLAGVYADKIVYERTSMSSLEFAISGWLVAVLIVFLGPLLVYAPKLIRAKSKGLLDYGALATEYTRSFDQKWNRANPQDLLGTSDIQSLADIGNAFAVMTRMQPVPFGLSAVVMLGFAALAPLALLLPLSKPVEEIVRAIVGQATKIVR